MRLDSHRAGWLFCARVEAGRSGVSLPPLPARPFRSRNCWPRTGPGWADRGRTAKETFWHH